MVNHFPDLSKSPAENLVRYLSILTGAKSANNTVLYRHPASAGDYGSKVLIKKQGANHEWAGESDKVLYL